MSKRSKWLGLLVLFVMLAALVTACGGGGGDDGDDLFRVAVIMPSTITDLAFSQSMYDALLMIQ